MKSKNKIRVVECIYNFRIAGEGGGITRFVVDLCNQLDRDLLDVHICGLWKAKTEAEIDLIDQLNKSGIKAYAATQWNPVKPYQSFTNALRRLRDYFARYPMDIFHSHSEFGDIAALYFGMFRTTPKIVRTVHYGYESEWRNRPLRRLLLTNILYPLSFTQEVGVSQGIVDRLNRRDISSLLKKSAIYINNAIDLDRFSSLEVDKNLIRQSLGLPVDCFLVGSVGRLTEQKGYSILIEAAALTVKIDPNIKFILVGDGELKQELEALANQLNLGERFRFLGPRNDVEKVLHAMDLFVSASLWEGLPTVIMESMAAGVPVLATDIPGSNDLIDKNETGWLVPLQDSYSMAEKILSIKHTSNSEREKICQAAKEKASIYSIRTVAEKHTHLYQTICDIR